ncbi:uncharacterized protein LOC136088691 [Hydra vulgaris]|uniref:Uncharacterized protein LOC136088691 n=1 Tax=Hydra vulgaris TaxID=6087 RepID=A0ABM4D4I5_HYDVU
MPELSTCCIGKALNEQCYLSNKSKRYQELSKLNQELISLRNKINFIDFICSYHKKVYLSRYENEHRRYCCNPLNKHAKNVKNSLRVISLSYAKDFGLIPGQKICTSCRKVLNCKHNTKENELQEKEIYVDNHTLKEDLNSSIASFGCSPLKLVSKKDRVAYGKRKIDSVRAHTQKAVANVLGLEIAALCGIESPSKKCLKKTNTDLDNIMTQIKSKFEKTLSNSEKITLLTLTPDSWSIEKTQKFFFASKRSVVQARKLSKKSGILSKPSPKSGRKLSEDVITEVVHFYECDEYSRVCPGKKEFVSVKVDSKKQHIQKRLLLVNMKELHIEFKKKYNYLKVGFSKFCELRPKWCIPVGGASGLHAVCVCQYHQNVKLLVQKIPGISDYKILLKLMVCSIKNRDCMLHSCDKCPAKKVLLDYIDTLFTEKEISEVNFYQWQKSNYQCTLVPATLPLDEFIEMVYEQLDSLRVHHFISKSQATYYQHLKTNLKENQALVLLDFAENYSFLIQDAVQGFHWNNSQATVHPFVAYFIKDGKLDTQSYCVISDHLKHGTDAVHCFIGNVIDKLKQLQTFEHIIYFSDGAASQYKNYKNLINLCYHKHDFDMIAEWHFFATSHGKSPCDGVGGTVKRLVARASLQSLNDPIDTPSKMYSWCVQHVKGISFFFVDKVSIETHTTNFNLEERYRSCSTIPGTRNHHSFIPMSLTSIKIRRVSFDIICTNVDFSTCRIYINKISSYSPGEYVACVYDAQWYLGNILSISEEHQDLNMKFMKKSLCNKFTWPCRDDLCWVPLMHILCKVQSLKVQSNSGRFYSIDLKEIN